jgi:hypothetical protein
MKALAALWHAIQCPKTVPFLVYVIVTTRQEAVATKDRTFRGRL